MSCWVFHFFDYKGYPKKINHLGLPMLAPLIPTTTVRRKRWASGFGSEHLKALCIQAFAGRAANASDSSILTSRQILGRAGTSSITGTESASTSSASLGAASSIELPKHHDGAPRPFTLRGSSASPIPSNRHDHAGNCAGNGSAPARDRPWGRVALCDQPHSVGRHADRHAIHAC